MAKEIGNCEKPALQAELLACAMTLGGALQRSFWETRRP